MHRCIGQDPQGDRIDHHLVTRGLEEDIVVFGCVQIDLKMKAGTAAFLNGDAQGFAICVRADFKKSFKRTWRDFGGECEHFLQPLGWALVPI